MVTDFIRPHSEENRQLLQDSALARRAYHGYLKAVANGERQADPAELEELKSRYEESLERCRNIQAAWDRTPHQD